MKDDDAFLRPAAEILDGARRPLIVDTPHPRCDHRQGWRVDERALKVFCSSCGAEAEAIRVVIDLMLRWRVYDASAQASKREAKRLFKEVADLKRERSRLRAQNKKIRTCPE